MIRYQALDRCFRNPWKKYFIEDLIEACNQSIQEFTQISIGIKRRQIFEDIKFMESAQGWNVPLEHYRDIRKVYYRYSDKNFSINSQPLNEIEENQLKEALVTIGRFKGMPQFEWIDEITARLDAGLGLSKHKDKIIEFEQNSYLRGLEHITTLYNAIVYHRTLRIAYHSFKHETSQTIILHPYFLKQYNNRWFAFGKNDTNQFVMTLGLDRITAISECDNIYETNKNIDFDEYFEDVIGVTVETDKKPERIALKVKNTLSPYIQTKPIHGSQRLKEKGTTHSIFTVDLIPNYELESIVLSYGEGMEVIAPQSLRNRIKERVRLIYNNYKENCAD